MTRCIRRAEWEYQKLDFDKDIEQPMVKAGWNLDFIYLDQNLNRFKL